MPQVYRLLIGLSVLCLTILAVGCAQAAVAQEPEPSPLHCVDSNGNGVIDRSEVIGVINAYLSGTRITHPGVTPTPEPSPTPTHTPTPSPTPTAPEPDGSRNNPWPLGWVIEVWYEDSDERWEITVLDTTPDATGIVLAENQFNDPPDAGNQFFIAKVRAKYLGPGSTNFSGDIHLGALGDGGVLYTTYGNSCGVIPDRLPNPVLFTNGTIEGNVCWQIDSADADSLLMAFGDAYLTSVQNAVWFDLNE